MPKITLPLPPIEVLSKSFSYNPETGDILWKVSAGTAKAGSVAGCLAEGYILLGCGRRLLKAHRVAWMLHYGVDPVLDIDHKNGIGTDNRIENLRLATVHENTRNARMRNDNTSGIKGVCWCKRRRKWKASLNGIYVGYFDSKDDAATAVQNRRLELHGEFACSRV